MKNPATATSPTSSTERVIDGLQTVIERSAGSGQGKKYPDVITADMLPRWAASNAQADGADPQIVDGQRADGDEMPDIEGVTLGRAAVIDEGVPALSSNREETALEHLNNALQILRTAGQGLVSSPMAAYNLADVDAIDRRIVNAIELLKAGAR